MKLHNLFRIKYSMFVLATIACMTFMTSCYHQDEHDDCPILNADFNGPLTVNEKDAIHPQKAELFVVEGHLHTRCNPVGDIFWTKSDGGFHANPAPTNDTYPLKRRQKMTYILGDNNTYNLSGEDAIRIMSSGENGTHGGGHQYALLFKLFDKDGNRLDLKYRQPEYADRVQVFYRITDIQPLRDGYPLPKPANEIKKDSLFYYWYFDRLTDSKDRSPEILRNPLGFRGVFLNLDAPAKYNLEIVVTILPKGMTKGKYVNSVSPKQEQLKHIAYILKVPFRNVTKDITPFKPADMPQEEFDKIQEADAERKQKALMDESGYTEEQLRDAEINRAFLSPESSNFWL